MQEGEMNRQRDNGETGLRNVLGSAFERCGVDVGCFSVAGGNLMFCENPAQYYWNYIGKQEILVPYNCSARDSGNAKNSTDSPYPHTRAIRWEQRSVQIVESILHRGESNVLPRRRFYIDEPSSLILLGEGYDITDRLVKCYMLDRYGVLTAGARGRWYQL
jgi:hypothetical protein